MSPSPNTGGGACPPVPYGSTPLVRPNPCAVTEFTINAWDVFGKWTDDRISCRHSALTSSHLHTMSWKYLRDPKRLHSPKKFENNKPIRSDFLCGPTIESPHCAMLCRFVRPSSALLELRNGRSPMRGWINLYFWFAQVLRACALSSHHCTGVVFICLLTVWWLMKRLDVFFSYFWHPLVVCYEHFQCSLSSYFVTVYIDTVHCACALFCSVVHVYVWQFSIFLSLLKILLKS